MNGVYEELTPQSSHVKEGFYFRWMKRYFNFFPRHQIKVYIFEEFKEDPTRVVLDPFDFLNVDTNLVPNKSVKHNTAAVPKIRSLNRLFYDPTLIRTAKSVLPEGMQRMAKRIRRHNLKAPPKFPADLRAQLLDLYREDILKLQELLGRDLSIWLEGTD